MFWSGMHFYVFVWDVFYVVWGVPLQLGSLAAKLGELKLRVHQVMKELRVHQVMKVHNLMYPEATFPKALLGEPAGV